MKAGNNPPAVLAAFLIVGLLAAGGVGYLIYDIEQAASGYEKAEGTVLGTHVEEYPGTETGQDLPVVEYRYTYEGKTYENDNVFAGPSDQPDNSIRGDGPSAEEVVDRFETGETVTVYVNPDDPRESYLIKRGPSNGLYFMMAFFGLFAVGGGYGLVRNHTG